MSAVSSLQDDRRHLRRYPAAELEVRIRPRLQLFGQGEVVEAHDFTRSGLGITTSRSLKEGQRLILDLNLRLDRGEIQQNRLVAVVQNARSDGDRWRYGLRFDYNANRHMRALSTQARVGRIEGILDRIEKLKAKTMGGDELLEAYGKNEKADRH